MPSTGLLLCITWCVSAPVVNVHMCMVLKTPWTDSSLTPRSSPLITDSSRLFLLLLGNLIWPQIHCSSVGGRERDQGDAFNMFLLPALGMRSRESICFFKFGHWLIPVWPELLEPPFGCQRIWGSFGEFIDTGCCICTICHQFHHVGRVLLC